VSGREWTLPAAGGLAALEAAALIAVLLTRDSKSAPLYAILLVVKFPFCALLLRRSPAAWFALILWEGTGVFAAAVAPRVPVYLRLLELGMAVGVLTLLVAALPLFPRMDHMELPER
jgi:hypothetical protein